MTIYIVDIDNLTIEEKTYENVLNLEQFERDLDDIYPDSWCYSLEDALSHLSH